QPLAIGRPRQLLEETPARKVAEHFARPGIHKRHALEAQRRKLASIRTPACPREFALRAEHARVRAVALRHDQGALLAVTIAANRLVAFQPPVKQPRAVARELRRGLVPLRRARESAALRAVWPHEKQVPVA